MKIAITSSDGTSIDTQFEKASMVYIYSKEGNNIQLIEKRDTNNKRIARIRLAGERNTFERLYKTIKDCDITYTRKIQQIPAQRCQLLGVKVKQAEGEISQILKYKI